MRDTDIGNFDAQWVAFRCRPAMAVQTRIRSAFHRLPIREIPGRLGPSPERDMLAVLETAAELEQTENDRGTFIVPVHFDTLATKEFAHHYQLFAADKLSQHRERVMFEIVGLPSAGSFDRLGEILEMLAPIARRTIAQVPCQGLETIPNEKLGLYAIGFDASDDSMSETDAMQAMKYVANVAQRSNCKSYVKGIKTASLLTLALSAGFNYISGPVIGAASRLTAEHKVFRPDALYRELLKMAS